jgi:hypothetical protein
VVFIDISEVEGVFSRFSYPNPNPEVLGLLELVVQTPPSSAIRAQSTSYLILYACSNAYQRVLTRKLPTSPFYPTTNQRTMNADNLSESDSAFTAELDDLTIVHAQSELTTSHDSHRTEEGFLIDPKRLPRCVPLPANKRALDSWV